MTKKIQKHLKISPHHHTARRLPNQHTSYVLLIILVLLGLLLMRTVLAERKGVLATVTQAGSVNVAAVVPGPVPTVGATILLPSDGTTTTHQSTVISGTCGSGLLVKVYKNAILAGSTVCSVDGNFNLQISLLPGRNDLTALNFDSLNQAGPVTPTVVVYLQIPDTGDSDGDGDTTEFISIESTQPITSHTMPVPAGAFYLSTDYELRGLKMGQPYSWKLSVFGGTAPYTISIDWGDTTKEEVLVAASGLTELSHAYLKAGDFKITINAIDAKDQKTYLELVAIVDGVKEAAVVPGSTTVGTGTDYWMIASIASYAMLFVGVCSFAVYHHRHPPMINRI